MSADNPKCHEKGCLCATCLGKCSYCVISGLCPDDICKSDTGKRKCPMYSGRRVDAELEGTK